ncbi:hypothetical protein BGZ58_005639, partial [Dissophora ornata]
PNTTKRPRRNASESVSTAGATRKYPGKCGGSSQARAHINGDYRSLKGLNPSCAANLKRTASDLCHGNHVSQGD